MNPDGHVSKHGVIFNKVPPRLPKMEEINEEVTPWADILIATIPDHLKLLMLREDEINEDYEIKIKKINQWVTRSNPTAFQEYFYTYFVEYSLEETKIIQKWIKYWLKLYEMASQTRVLPEVESKELGVSEQELEMAKESPIQDLMGGDIRVNGNRLLACCPFHGEKTPSFTIFTDDNHFHCFGCGEHGDAVDFVMKMKKINLIEAVKDINRG